MHVDVDVGDGFFLSFQSTKAGSCGKLTHSPALSVSLTRTLTEVRDELRRRARRSRRTRTQTREERRRALEVLRGDARDTGESVRLSGARLQANFGNTAERRRVCGNEAVDALALRVAPVESCLTFLALVDDEVSAHSRRDVANAPLARAGHIARKATAVCSTSVLANLALLGRLHKPVSTFCSLLLVCLLCVQESNKQRTPLAVKRRRVCGPPASHTLAVSVAAKASKLALLCCRVDKAVATDTERPAAAGWRKCGLEACCAFAALWDASLSTVCVPSSRQFFGENAAAGWAQEGKAHRIPRVLERGHRHTGNLARN